GVLPHARSPHRATRHARAGRRRERGPGSQRHALSHAQRSHRIRLDRQPRRRLRRHGTFERRPPRPARCAASAVNSLCRLAETMNVPTNLLYTREHEWVRLVDDTTALVGITDYAQNSLGDITFVELPKAGSVLTTGATFGVVESVKAASDLYAPV